MALVIGNSQVKVMHHYIQDSSILTLSYPGSRVDQLWSKLEDIAIIVTILSPGCQQPFLVKMASDNRLSAAIFGPKWLVTTGCQQPLPNINDYSNKIIIPWQITIHFTFFLSRMYACFFFVSLKQCILCSLIFFFFLFFFSLENLLRRVYA